MTNLWGWRVIFCGDFLCELYWVWLILIWYPRFCFKVAYCLVWDDCFGIMVGCVGYVGVVFGGGYWWVVICCLGDALGRFFFDGLIFGLVCLYFW